MADHGTVQYATATGNDLPAHEAAYRSFMHLATVGTLTAVGVLFGLTVGGVMGHWLMGLAVFLIALIGAIPAIATGSNKPAAIACAICFLIFVFAGATAISH